MRAIYFDLDGTLLELTRAYDEILADAFQAVEGDVRDGWIDAYDERFFEAFEACESDPHRRGFSAVSDDPEALVEALREREVAACRPPAGVHDHLERLGATYRLGVLTNGEPAWQRHKLAAHDLERHFEAVVASYETGAHKPAREPFALAERRLPAEAYAMVGDADADVEGASAAGWTAHRYRGGGFADLDDAIEWD